MTFGDRDLADAVEPSPPLRARRGTLSRMKRLLASAPASAWFGMIVILGYAICALFAPWVAPYGEAEIFERPYAPWGEEFPLGTDQLGRDMLTRLIYGARNTIGIALATTLLAFLIGGSLGILAGYRRGWLDQIVSRLVDALMSIPQLIFALLLMSIVLARFGTAYQTLMLIIIIAFLDSTRVFRLARALTHDAWLGQQPP